MANKIKIYYEEKLYGKYLNMLEVNKITNKTAQFIANQCAQLKKDFKLFKWRGEYIKDNT